MLLHSYNVAKQCVKQQDHLGAAKLLSRVSESIRSFPSHAVPILTSTVIECQRASLKGAAYTFACELMKPQYRADIQEAYKKKIEQVVRKSGSKQDEVEPTNVPCIYCGTEGEDTKLKCDNCLSIVPYCIVSGLRMLKDDFTQCPHCKFPGRHSLFLKLAKEGAPCPMCSKDVKPDQIKKFANFRWEWSQSEEAKNGDEAAQ
jgi:WD repeat-containing protein 19